VGQLGKEWGGALVGWTFFFSRETLGLRFRIWARMPKAIVCYNVLLGLHEWTT